MGMFDSVIAKCPDCGFEVEFQSKAGKCLLSTYFAESDLIPAEIARDLDHESAVCPECGTVIELVTGMDIPRIPMRVIRR